MTDDNTDHDDQLLADYHAGVVRLDDLPQRLHERARTADRVIAGLRNSVDADEGALARISARLGFDQPEIVYVRWATIEKSRRDRKISATGLLAALAEAGIKVDRGTYRSWVAGGEAVGLPRRTATALAAILNTSVADFTVADPSPSLIERFLQNSATLGEVIRSYAERTGRSVEDLFGVVSEQLPTMAYRATEVSDDDLLDIARALLEAESQ